MVSVVVLSLVLAVTSCSGGGEGGEGDGGGRAESQAGDSLAELAVIDTDVGVRVDGAEDFEEGEEGQPLAVGDSIQTNPTGFGEVNYFDGSVTRVAQSAEFTMVALSDEEGERQVATRLDSGTSWSRVERLSGSEGAYSVETPVALATATGTAFVADCTDLPTSCTFWATEGTILLTADDGTALSMSAPSRLAVEAGEPFGVPEALVPDAMYEDDWVATNTDLDLTRGGSGDDGSGDDGSGDDGAAPDEPTDADLAIATISGEWDSAVTIDQAASDPCCTEGATEGWDISLDCSDGADGVDCTTNREAGATGETADDVITAVAPGVYDVTATGFEPCVDPGTGAVAQTAGFATTKTGRYQVTDAELVDGRWQATAMEGRVTNTYTLNAVGVAAGCSTRGGGATDTVVADVAVSR